MSEGDYFEGDKIDIDKLINIFLENCTDLFLTVEVKG